jgi:L-histidine Nalpha-methyltransferase / hercynylcysteine S-oxide synthase
MHGTYDDGIAFIERGGLRTNNNNNDGYMRVPSPIEHTSRHASRAPSTAGTGSPASEGAPSSLASVSDATPPSSPGAATAEHGPLHMLFLGSSLGNFARGEDAAFLRALPLRPGAGDTLLLGLDHANEPGLIERAYNDDRGHTTAFIMNGLRVAGRSLGDERIFEEGKWEYVNRYDVEQRECLCFPCFS